MINHIAIIPDGNRRWAQKNRKTLYVGYLKGGRSTETLIKAWLKLQAPYLTIWGCSVNNITQRTKAETKILFKVIEKEAKKLLTSRDLVESQVKIRVLGKWQEYFPSRLIKLMEELMAKTKTNESRNLTLLLAYSGVEEMAEAVASLVKSGTPAGKITPRAIKRHLYTADLPPVDLLIRTGGEPHNSDGFMMWDTAFTKYYFSDNLYPDFEPEEFISVVKKSEKIKPRLGK